MTHPPFHVDTRARAFTLAELLVAIVIAPPVVIEAISPY